MSALPPQDAPETPAHLLHRSIANLRKTSALHGVMLGLFALVTALVLSLVHDLTARPISERISEDLYATLAQVIPPTRHNNDLAADPFLLTDAKEGEVLVYRARRDAAVTAVAFKMNSVGYAGRIQVLLGVDRAGELLGVRVLSHRETPGLGDKIEVEKSDWILQFNGMSLGKPETSRWKVRKDGGEIDQFSGATITPRATVEAIRRGLEFFARNEAALLDPSVGSQAFVEEAGS
ncbi:MAG: electron transport complex subunit RsxG [Pseudomonadota bacterium]